MAASWATRLGIAAAGMLLLASSIACHSFFSNSSASHLAYVSTSNGIVGYRIDNKSGSATAIFTSPFVIGNSPAGIVVHPSNQFAYVANQLDNTISLLKIDSSSGTLSEVMPRPQAGLSPQALALDQNGNHLFVADQGSNDIKIFSVGTNGALSPVSTTPMPGPPSDMVMPLSSNFLYVTVPAFSDIFDFSVSSGSLTAVPNSPFHINSSLGVGIPGINQTGTLLYVPNPLSGASATISGFSIASNGALSQLITSPFSDCPLSNGTANCTTTAPVPIAAIVDPSGRFLYVANSSAALSQFSIDGSTGTLTALTATAPSSGSNPSFFMFDPDGKYLYLANVGSISEFTLNSDGSLATTSNTIQVGGTPRGIALTH